MRLQNNLISREVAAATLDAEKILSEGSPMLEEIRLKNDFRFNSGTGEEAYQKIINCKTTLPIYSYRPLWKFSKALGYSGKGAIHINLYKLGQMGHADLVGLLCHEWLHGGPGFSHGNNYKTEEKVNFSVNYWVSENIGRWL